MPISEAQKAERRQIE